jgi:alpha-tubulin suppressor-like RCC1 family protein
MVSVGTSHVAAVRSDGILFTWGLNNAGQLGTGDTVYRSTITQVGSSSWTAVSAGNSYTAAIRQDGKLFSWGLNSIGQLGDGTTVNKSTPVQIGSSSWTAVAAGNAHTTAIRLDNILFVWGLNSTGQLGDSTTVNKSSPVQISSSSWTAISAGQLHNLALTSTGNLFAWGSGVNGELGVPALTASESRWSDIRIGHDHVLAIQYGTGKLYAWGRNNQGQLGDGTTIDRPYPVQIGTSSWTAISAGARYSVAIRSGGTLFSWGLNVFGMLGDNTSVNKSSPTQIGSSSWTAVSAGNYHTVAIRNSVTLFTWGLGTSGQLGDSTTVTKSSPVQIGSSSWTAVSAGNGYSMAIRNGGTLFGWGVATSGQLGDSTTVTKSSPVQIGSSSWTAISAGMFHTAGTILSGTDNYLFVWGRAAEGQLGTTYGMTTQSWTTVASGASHTVAIRSDGLLFAWGLNTSGQLGDSTTISKSSPVQVGASSWTLIAARGNTSFAKRQDGYLYAWGLGTSGQLGTAVVSNQSNPAIVGLLSTSSNISWKFGPDGYLSTSAAFNTAMGGWAGTTWTVEVWVYFTSFTNNVSNVIMATYACVAGNGRWYLVAVGTSSTTGQVEFGWTTSTSTQDQFRHTGANISTNTWTHVAMTLNATTSTSTTINLFVGGIISTATARNLSTQTANFGAPLIGRFDACGAIYFLGSMSNLRIVKGDQLYTANFTPSTTSLGVAGSGTTILLTCNGSTLLDKSAGAYVLTQTGSISITESNPFTANIDAVADFANVYPGGTHTFAITSNSTMYTWGLNNAGQLGDGTTVNKSSPVQIGSSSWTAVASGASHTVAINASGTLFAWGLNSSGQIGDGTTTNKSSPIQIGNSSWTAVSAGLSHNAAIRSGGTLFTWGVNSVGQIGDSTTVSKSSPVQIGSSSWTAISAGDNYSFAINSSNKLYAWGLNSLGQLGTDRYVETVYQYDEGLNAAAYVSNWSNTTTQSMDNFGFLGSGTGHGYVPSTNFILTLKNLPVHNQIRYQVYWHFVDTHDGETNTLDIDGVRYLSFTKLYTNASITTTINNLLKASFTSTGTDTGYSYAPETGTTSSHGYVEIDTGWIDHTQENLTVDHLFGLNEAITNESCYLTHVRVEARIDNTSGTYLLSYVSPVQVGTSNWSRVSAGGTHTSAIGTNNLLYTWGLNNAGQLGLGSSINRLSPIQVGTTANTSIVNSPVLVGSPGNFTKVTVGVYQTAYTYDGNVFVAGKNNFGQLGTGDDIDRFTFTSLWPKQYEVYSYSKFSSQDSTANDDPQSGIGWDSVTQLSYAWGENDFGQLGDSTTIDRLSPIVMGQGGATRSSPVQIGTGSWKKIAAGNAHSMGIDSGDLLFTWGLNNVGQLGDGTTVSRASPVQVGASSWKTLAAGNSHSAAINSNDKLYSWGLNVRGQLGIGINQNRSSPTQIGSANWSNVALGGNSFVSYGLA